MKSEFILAFNEICESRGLPKEDVFEALKTALVSAYRRDANLSSKQEVRVEIDPRTGEPTIFCEKEVVEDIVDDRTEVLIDVARREGHVDAELGDLVMVDSTTESFGRIAAQTAKQVLLQRVREAEREHLFEDFSGREGELVNGTVQSISGQNITIGLGRTEAVMPKNQQVGNERYRPHDKIRVYVLEVRRSARGPQIVVSRNHRNLLRRLLELEVPEIYNGQVDIKSIAREAGQRSKVAVQALQQGVDPVGACVGMRGVRIQSIVRELNDEKIDVIEWDPDQRVFIAKALSPARVSHVFLEEHPEEGKTAIVIVPDDQLSLAIGREGQNARLAAKLTGWRIDIKSLTEAATDSLSNLDNPAADQRITADPAFLDQVRAVLEKKSAGRPVTAEDYLTLDRLVAGVEGKIVASRAAEYESVRRERMQFRKRLPETALQLPIDVLDLRGRPHNMLLDAEVNTIGDLLRTLERGDEYFLSLRGLDHDALEMVKTALASLEVEVEAAAAAELAEVAEVAESAEAAEAVEEPVAEVPVEEAIAEPAAPVTEVPEEVIEEDDLSEEELAIDIAEFEEIAAAEEAAAAAAVAAAAPALPVEPALPIDDLSKPLVEIEPEVVAPKKEKKGIVVVRPAAAAAEEKTEDAGKKKKKKAPRIIEDEAAKIAARKPSGARKEDWVDDVDLETF